MLRALGPVVQGSRRWPAPGSLPRKSRPVGAARRGRRGAGARLLGAKNRKKSPPSASRNPPQTPPRPPSVDGERRRAGIRSTADHRYRISPAAVQPLRPLPLHQAVVGCDDQRGVPQFPGKVRQPSFSRVHARRAFSPRARWACMVSSGSVQYRSVNASRRRGPRRRGRPTSASGQRRGRPCRERICSKRTPRGSISPGRRRRGGWGEDAVAKHQRRPRGRRCLSQLSV